MSMQTGKQSICFETPPYIVSSASIVGKKEGEGPLGACFDLIGEDDKFGQDTWEEAESTLQKEAFGMAVGKAGLKKEEIRYLFSGDLLGQNIATSFGLMDYQVPLWPVWCVQYLRRGAFPWSNVCCCRICRLRCGDDIEPFCQRRKAVPVST